MAGDSSIRDHVIVDGSNIATEGRTLPSLRQLDEAVTSFLEEFPGTRITAIVDATFGHRIEAVEKEAYEQAVLAGELVAPPAGAIGRGDAFVLAIADKASATILSNDSFQEFHDDYPWLFDAGRLIGGKPVDGVGWVFVGRLPVRGPSGRRSARGGRSAKSGAAKPRLTKAERDEAAKAVEAEVAARRGRTPSPGRAEADATSRPPRRRRGQKVAASLIAEAADEAARTSGSVAAGAIDDGGDDGSPTEVETPVRAEDDAGGDGRRGRRRRSPVKAAKAAKAVDAINEPSGFLSFTIGHPVGTEVEGTVDRFSSHGAYVVVDGVHCYVPLRSMADPPPRRARDVLSLGESLIFVVASFDAPRRSIDLALPGQQMTGDSVSDPYPDEEAPPMAPAKKAAAKKKAPAKRAATRKKAAARKAPSKKATARKSPSKKAPAKKNAGAKKAPAKKTPAKKKAPAKKTPAKKKAPAKRKAPAKKAPAKRKAGAKKVGAKKAPARKKVGAKRTGSR